MKPAINEIVAILYCFCHIYLLMAEARVGKQGRIVIPSQLREELGLSEGDTLVARVEDDRLIMETRLAALERLRRRFREGAAGRDLVAELIAERRAEARREEEEIDEFRRSH
ncbi:MAG TPA: AbrB/MazE/SpoVT family DNA-binding domain-containing protein [Solirubrobacterales bacterium]